METRKEITEHAEEAVKQRFYSRFSDKPYPKKFTDIVNEICKDFAEVHLDQLQKAREEERERFNKILDKYYADMDGTEITFLTRPQIN